MHHSTQLCEVMGFVHIKQALGQLCHIPRPQFEWIEKSFQNAQPAARLLKSSLVDKRRNGTVISVSFCGIQH